MHPPSPAATDEAGRMMKLCVLKDLAVAQPLGVRRDKVALSVIGLIIAPSLASDTSVRVLFERRGRKSLG
jgi:hypothetical protein